MGNAERRGVGEEGSWATLKFRLVWHGHGGQGERGRRDPHYRTVPAGSARGLAWNVPSRVVITPAGSDVAARCVPRAACAAPLARAAALCRRAERARLSCRRHSASLSETRGRPSSSRRLAASVVPLTWRRRTLAHTAASSRPSRQTGTSKPRRDTSLCSRRRWSQ